MNRLNWMILTAVFKCPWLFPSQDPVEDPSVDHATVQAEVIVERRPDVSHCVQLFPHPGVLQALSVLRHMETWDDKKKKNY